MRRIAALPFAAARFASVRQVTCSTFADAVRKAQDDVAKTKSKEATAAGKRLFETEYLDDISADKTTMTPVVARDIANAAAALRIRPSAGTAFTDTITWALKPEMVSKVPAEPLSRLLHAAVVLRAPQLFDLLMRYLWRVVELAPKMDPVVCAVVINAYGRAGVKHAKLYEALGQRATAVMDKPAVTLAHVANVSYALSRVGYQNPKLFAKLKAQFLKMKGQAAPLVAASVLESFAAAGALDDELFTAIETILVGAMDQCAAPLVTSVLATTTKSGRTKSKLFEVCCQRTIKIAGTFDPSSIAKTMSALFEANVTNEDLLAALAERGCKIPAEFRVGEAKQVLEALSHFVLYDPELFPLLGSRVASVIRARGVYDICHIASILASFAAVHERHEDLIYVGGRALADSAAGLPAATCLEALYAFAVHNVRSDAQRRLMDAARSRLPELEAAATSEVAQKRLAVVKKALQK